MRTPHIGTVDHAIAILLPAAFIAKYRGKFDQGWDKVRQETFERQKKLGIIPKDAVLPPANPGIQA